MRGSGPARERVRVTVLPRHTVLDGRAGQSILDIAIDNDYLLEHACGGCCACITCRISVADGSQNLSPMRPDERSMLSAYGALHPRVRLSCQAKVNGRVVIEIPD